MRSPEQGFNPEAKKSVEALQTRLDNIYAKFGVDPNEDVNVGDINFMLKATVPGSKEWAQTKLELLRDMVQEASLGDDYYKEADDALKSWERDEPTKKVEGMRKLTEVYRKHTSGEDLTVDELKFLYETGATIEGVGYNRDPRIEKILANRDRKADMQKIERDEAKGEE